MLKFYSYVISVFFFFPWISSVLPFVSLFLISSISLHLFLIWAATICKTSYYFLVRCWWLKVFFSVFKPDEILIPAKISQNSPEWLKYSPMGRNFFPRWNIVVFRSNLYTGMRIAVKFWSFWPKRIEFTTMDIYKSKVVNSVSVTVSVCPINRIFWY